MKKNKFSTGNSNHGIGDNHICACRHFASSHFANKGLSATELEHLYTHDPARTYPKLLLHMQAHTNPIQYDKTVWKESPGPPPACGLGSTSQSSSLVIPFGEEVRGRTKRKATGDTTKLRSCPTQPPSALFTRERD